MRLEYGEWLPDQPSFGTSGMTVAQNVYPRSPLGYRPVGQFTQYVPAGPAAFLGGGTFTSPIGENIIIAGTAGNLYRVTSGAWASIGSGYTMPLEGRWRFAQFGGLAIATNSANPMQKIDLSAGTVTALGGSPPTFRMLAVVKDFLVGGVLNGQGNTFGWCAINNAEDWNFGYNQSDYQIMASGGDINGIFGGEFGIILQRNRITRMHYVGGNNIFVINEVSSNFGCVSPHSVIQHGQIGCFLSDNGFMMWDGALLKPIGNERIDRFFKASYGRNSWALMSAAVDIANQVFCWSMGDRVFCYHWNLDRWSIIVQPAQIIFSGVTRTISMDEQDPTYGANDDNLDFSGLPSLDSNLFKGGDNRFYLIDTTNTLGTMTGTPMAATLTLPDFELAPGRETQMRNIRVDTDALTGITLSLAMRPRLGDAVTYTDYTSLRANGDMPVRQRGRYTRAQLAIAAGNTWTFASGVEADAAPGAKQ